MKFSLNSESPSFSFFFSPFFPYLVYLDEAFLSSSNLFFFHSSISFFNAGC